MIAEPNTESQRELTPNEKRMATENVRLLVLKYSIPTIIGMLLNALYNVVDRFWVGRIPSVGDAALTGVGLSMPIMTVMMGCSQLAGLGAASCISIELGKGNKINAEKILGNCFTYIVAINIVFTLITLLNIEPLLMLFGATESTLGFASPYLTVIIAGSFFSMVSFALNHPIRATGNPKRFAMTQVVGAVVNIILDPIFIMGLNMGIVGAAYATVIAQFVSFLLVMSYYYTGTPVLRIKLKNMIPSLKTIIQISKIGASPFAMQIMASITALFSFNALKQYGLLELGSDYIAIGAMTIVQSLTVFILMPIFGINQGTQPIIGYNYGAKNYERVKEAYKWSVIYSLAICIFGYIVIEAFAPFLVSLFNDKDIMVQTGAKGLRIVMIVLPFVGFQIPTANFFQAVGSAAKSIFLSLLRQFFLLIPLFIFLPKVLGLTGVWLAYPVSDTISTVITAIFIYLEFKLIKKTFTQANAVA